ncbi:MAG: alanine racemase [Planctomycetota bacterium]|nr:alanine racemase [Planctomycetota bacterium]
MTQNALRSTKAIIDLAAIRSNLNAVRKRLENGTRVLVVVKGNAYGLGAVNISRMLQRSNSADYLGVAALSEAIELRKAGISLPILMFTEAFIEECMMLLRNDITLTVFSFESAKDLNVVAGASGTTSCIHLKVDTGMGRVGCPYEEAADIAARIKRELKYTNLEGIYTHLSVADEPEDGDNRQYTEEQILKLARLKKKLTENKVRVPILHCANTGAVLNFPSSRFDMVRVGISAYGCHPSPQGERLPLKGVLTLKSKVIYVKRIPAGTCISYGREYVTEKETTIATIPIGYGDGYPRALSGKGVVAIDGRTYPIAGRVCMDMIMVDVGDHEVKVDDEVVLIGTGDNDELSLEGIAEKVGTIPYEILTRISSRVPRVHIGEEGIDLAEDSP